MSKQQRELTELEKRFVKEAEAGYFVVDYEDNGKPCAYGARDTDNLFSMDVEQEHVNKDESLYYLRDAESDG